MATNLTTGATVVGTTGTIAAADTLIAWAGSSVGMPANVADAIVALIVAAIGFYLHSQTSKALVETDPPVIPVTATAPILAPNAVAEPTSVTLVPPPIS